MNKSKLNSKKLFLLLLYSPGITENLNEPIRGRTRIVKAMFLFEEEIKKKFIKNSNIEDIEMPDFYAWDYGPFSKEVYNDIEFFINNGFIENQFLQDELSIFEFNEFLNWADDYMFDDEKGFLLNYNKEEEFRLTDTGIKYIQKTALFESLTTNQKKILKDFKETINKASLEAILRYVYLKYPEYTKKSKIKDRIIG